MRELLLIAVVAALALVALRRPAVGMLTFIGLGFLNPQSIAWSTFRYSLVVGGATLAGYAVSGEPKRFPRQRESFLLLGLWATFGVSTIFAIYPDKAVAQFVEVSKILLMALLSTALLNSEQRLHSMLWVIALSLGFYGAKGGLFAIFTGGAYLVWGPEGSFLENNNAIGLALAMNTPILAYLANSERRTWLRWSVWVMLGLSCVSIICTFSRGAWLGLVTVVTLMALRGGRAIRVTAAVAAAIVLLAAPLWFGMLPERVTDRYSQLVNYETEDSAVARLWSWEFCRRVGIARPLTGGGFRFDSPETYAAYYPEFLSYYADSSSGIDNVRAWSCHSSWLMVFAEHGVPGLVLWLGLLGSCFLSLRRVRARARGSAEHAWARSCASALEIALVGFLVVGTFLDAAYFDMTYYLVAGTIILKELSGKAVAVAAEDPRAVVGRVPG